MTLSHVRCSIYLRAKPMAILILFLLSTSADHFEPKKPRNKISEYRRVSKQSLMEKNIQRYDFRQCVCSTNGLLFPGFRAKA